MTVFNSILFNEIVISEKKRFENASLLNLSRIDIIPYSLYWQQETNPSETAITFVCEFFR